MEVGFVEVAMHYSCITFRFLSINHQSKHQMRRMTLIHMTYLAQPEGRARL